MQRSATQSGAVRARPNQRKPGPSQADVARAAGVSTATVSRVLNESPLVRPKVRERIEAAMAELNYIPHSAARALAMNRSSTLGAIIPTLNNALFASGINAFERAARRHGQTLLLSVHNYDLDEEVRLVRTMIARGVDGLMLIGNSHRDAVFELLRSSGTRHLCAWAYDPAASAPNVGFANAVAMHAVVDHLFELGHRDFAMLTARLEGNDRASERVRGVRERLEHHGSSLDPRAVREIRYSVPEARVAFGELMALNDRPTAVICGSDVLAMGAVLEAAALGIAVPDAVSVTGFDNLPLAAELSPAITTVDLPADDMGEAAAARLLAAADVESVELAASLVIRGSTAAAASATR